MSPLYRTIVADPPWPHPDSGKRTQSLGGRWTGKWLGYVSEVPYERMSLGDIKAMRVGDYAEESAHLYLWTTNRFIEDGYATARAWGFRPSTLLTWAKAPMGIGLGGAFTITTEFIIFARRGSLPPLQRLSSTWFNWTRPFTAHGGPSHSQKPEGFIDMVESISPGPYLELFARRQRLGWETWGNECFSAAGVAL